MFIVSRNYRDRNASERWLVRKNNEEPEQAKAFISVIAQNVRFTRSSEEETGFGCTMIAAAKTVETNATEDKTPRKDEVKLRFCAYWFETTAGEEVVSCGTLRLTPSGAMYATSPKGARTRKESNKIYG